MVKVSFPGLGIDQFSFNKVAFTIGKLEVRWYGIIIVTGIILAFIYAAWRAKAHGISFDDMLDVAIYTVLAGIVGARLYYVLTTLGNYHSFLEVIAIWNGGIAIYGAIIGGGIALFITCKVKKLSWRKLFDCVAPGVMIAQAIGRWGNFFNGEAYGATPSESNPLYFLRMGLQHEGWSQEYFYQPDFLYESVWNLIGFIIINLLYKKKKYDGQIFLMYITWYGFGRMFIEGTRTDSLYVGVFRISQVVGFICFVAGTVMLIVFGIRARKAVLAEGDYDSVYGKVLGSRAAGTAGSSGKNAGETSEDADAAAEADEAAGKSEEAAKDALTGLKEETDAAAEELTEKISEAESEAGKAAHEVAEAVEKTVEKADEAVKETESVLEKAEESAKDSSEEEKV